MPSSPAPLPSPLWPAPLHHLALESADPERASDFFSATLQMRCERAPGGGAVLAGPGRIIVVEPGSGAGARHVAYGLDSSERVAELEGRFAGRGVPTEPAESPFLESGAFRVFAPDGAPDGNRASLRRPGGTALRGGRGTGCPDAFSTCVFRTPTPEPLLSFLVDEAGFVLSDRVGKRRPRAHRRLRPLRPGASLLRGLPRLPAGLRSLRARSGRLERSPRLGGPLRRAPGSHLVGSGSARPRQQPLPS